MLGCSTIWSITAEEFNQHRNQFEVLIPVNGYITGSQVKNFFTKSKLPNDILCQIWDLADYDKDGKLNLHEFSIAMHLIKRCQEGVDLPNNLPKEMMVPPNNFAFPDIVECSQSVPVAPSYSSVMAATSSSSPTFKKEPLPFQQPPLPQRRSAYIANTSNSGEWAIMQAVRPRYRLQFNQQDRLRKGYLTGQEAKSVLQRSGLPNNVLAHVWSLSDVDSDGRLTCEEFCVAMYLVEQARAGRQLPQTLPDSLIPPSMLGVSSTNSSIPLTTRHSFDPPPDWMLGNESKPGTLRATPDSPVVLSGTTSGIMANNHNYRFSFNEKQQNCADNDLFSLSSSSQRSQSRNSESDKQHQYIESECNKYHQVVEERNKEKVLLVKLKERQQALIEALAAEESKCIEYQNRLMESRDRVEQHRADIEGMRDERDKILDNTACLAEQLEAAKAEQGRCRRDRDSLQQKHQMNFGQNDKDSGYNRNNPFQEDMAEIKRQKQVHEQSIESLELEISELEASITSKNQNYQKYSSKLQELEQNTVKQRIPEIQRLKNDIQLKRNEVKELLNRQNHFKSNDPTRLFDEIFDDTNCEIREISNKPNVNDVGNLNSIISETNVNTETQITSLIKYIAQFSFTGRQADELSFNTGDVILVKADPSAPSGWLCGCLESKPNFYGLFPEIYVKKQTSPKPTSPCEQKSPIETQIKTNDPTFYSDLDVEDENLFDQTLPQGSTIKKAPQSNCIWVEAIYPWMMDTGDDVVAPNQLKFPIGQKIKVLEKSSDDWWKGEMFKQINETGENGDNKMEVGWFPQLYVKQISSGDETTTSNKYSSLSFAASNDISCAPRNSSNITNTNGSHGSGTNSSGGSSSGHEYCLALYPYESSVPGDLTMHPGDIIQLLGASKKSKQPIQQTDAWLKGHLRGAKETTGLFPAHYVRRLTQQEVHDTEQLTAMTSEYYTSLTIDANLDQSTNSGDTSISRRLVYDDIDQSTFHSANSPSPPNEEPSEINPPSSSYSNYCSLADTASSTDPTESLSASPIAKVTCVRDFQPTSPSGVSCSIGQEVFIIDRVSNPERLKVEIQLSGGGSKVGWIPRDCVESMAVITEGVELNESQQYNIKCQLPLSPCSDPMTASGYDKCLSLLPSTARSSRITNNNNRRSDANATPSAINQEHSPNVFFTPPTFIDNISSDNPMAMVNEANESIGDLHSAHTDDDDNQQQNSSTDNNDNIRIGETFMAMYPYSAQNPDELSFSKNSVIRLLSKDEPDWWKGCTLIPISSSSGGSEGQVGAVVGSQGLFPVNYVRRPDLNSEQDQKILAELGAAVTGIDNCSFPSATTDEANNAYSTVTGRPISWYIDGQVSFNALLTEDEKRRQFYIIELIETEKAYYDDLQEVHRVFYEPIKKSNLLSAEELRRIFLNWTDLIAKSYNFYMALKIRQDLAGFKQPIQCIGDILLSNFPNFIVYVRFCSMQNHAIATLERRKQSDTRFRELCAQCEQLLRCQKMPMTSYFLKPMQRITKYKLLVENVLKYTEDEHPDRGDMEEAVAAARSLCEAVNEGIREKENSERLEWIQEHVTCEPVVPTDSLLFNSATNSLGHRKLIHCGTLYKAKSGKELVGFLFNDFILLTTPCHNTNGCPFVFPLETSTSFNSKMNFKIYKKPILLNRVLIMTGVPSTQNSLSVTATTTVFGNVSNNDIFTIREAGSDHVLKALSLNDRDKWVERLVAASLQYIEIENSVREISMSIRRSAGIGRLIVTILEACNLKSNLPSESKVNAYCEVSLGNQLRRTKVIQATHNPKWHCNMQFLIKNLELDVLCLSVNDKDYFAPNEFLGRTEVSVKEIKRQKQRGPIERRLKLMGVNSGELLVRLDIALFRNEFGQ